MKSSIKKRRNPIQRTHCYCHHRSPKRRHQQTRRYLLSHIQKSLHRPIHYCNTHHTCFTRSHVDKPHRHCPRTHQNRRRSITGLLCWRQSRESTSTRKATATKQRVTQPIKLTTQWAFLFSGCLKTCLSLIKTCLIILNTNKSNN